MTQAPPRPSRFGFFLHPEFSLIALASASEPLRAANRVSRRQLYEWKLLGATTQAVAASNGASLLPDATLETAGPLDDLVVVASLNVACFRDEGVFAGLRHLAAHGCRIGGVSTAALLLARAELLDGYQCTVHWEHAAALSEEFPQLALSRDLFVIDRDRFTCGGGTAGLDMMLTLIERQHGRRLATAVAEQFLHTRIRPATDGQRMDIFGRYGIHDARLATAVTLMEQHIEWPLPLDAIALRSNVSGRQLERLFTNALGTTPGRFYLNVRLKAARQLLDETCLSVLQIALRCGFASASHLGKCYREAFAETPMRARRRRVK